MQQNQNKVLDGVLRNQTQQQRILSLIRNEFAKINTIKLCKILDIVDSDKKQYHVQALVSRASTDGSQMPADQFYEIFDAQEMGGNGGFIIDRKVGDIVIVGFFDRESTQQLVNGEDGALKSRGVCPQTSGVILNSVFYAMPDVFVKISSEIISKGEWTHTGNMEVIEDIKAKNINVTANLTIPAPLNFISGGATLTFQDLSGITHSVVNGLIVS